MSGALNLAGGLSRLKKQAMAITKHHRRHGSLKEASHGEHNRIIIRVCLVKQLSTVIVGIAGQKGRATGHERADTPRDRLRPARPGEMRSGVLGAGRGLGGTGPWHPASKLVKLLPMGSPSQG